MKQNHKLILSGILILAVGMLLGYLFFGTGSNGHQHPETAEAGEETIWTCSMHPQIRQNEPGDCPKCGMDLIPATKTATTDDPTILQMTPSAVALANIQTTTVEAGSPEKEIQLPGRIAVDERNTSFITALFPGRIERLYVNFTGQQVNRGQRVASIYSPELISAQRELIEAESLRQDNPELYRSVRSRLKLWGLTESQINSIEQQGEVVQNIDIYARESGIVTERMVSPGDYVETGMPLLSLANLSNLWVLFEAYENDIRFISEGDAVKFTAASAPGKTYEARVTFVDPVVDRQTRTATIRAEVTNSKGQLKPEMLVTGRLQAKTTIEGQQVVVPKSAVLWTGKRSVVYLSLKDKDVPSFRMQEITLGPSLGNFYVVEEGLQPGDVIVTNGVFTVDAQSQLSNRNSMMNRNVQVSGKTSQGAAAKVVPDYSAEAPEAFKEQLQQVVNAYLDIKNALVNDKPATEQQVNKATEATKNVDMSLVKGKAHDYWMQQQEALLAHLQNMKKSSQIEKQREEFLYLSTAMISTIEVFGISGPTLYLQYCPMANNDEGAHWLSSEEEIRNPYFGASMLKCGEVEEIYPGKK